MNNAKTINYINIGTINVTKIKMNNAKTINYINIGTINVTKCV